MADIQTSCYTQILYVHPPYTWTHFTALLKWKIQEILIYFYLFQNRTWSGIVEKRKSTEYYLKTTVFKIDLQWNTLWPSVLFYFLVSTYSCCLVLSPTTFCWKKCLDTLRHATNLRLTQLLDFCWMKPTMYQWAEFCLLLAINVFHLSVHSVTGSHTWTVIPARRTSPGF